MVPQVAGDGQFWQVTQVAGLLGMGRVALEDKDIDP